MEHKPSQPVTVEVTCDKDFDPDSELGPLNVENATFSFLSHLLFSYLTHSSSFIYVGSLYLFRCVKFIVTKSTQFSRSFSLRSTLQFRQDYHCTLLLKFDLFWTRVFRQLKSANPVSINNRAQPRYNNLAYPK